MNFDNMWSHNLHPHGPKQMQNWRQRKKKVKNQLLTCDKKKLSLMFYIRACNPHACDYKWMKNLHPIIFFKESNVSNITPYMQL